MLNIHTIINIIHILLIGPGLIYIGQTYGALPNIAFNIILVLGLGIMVYHAYKAYSIGIKYGWIYALHAAVFAPLLVYLGALGKKAHNAIYPLLTMVGFAAIGYHLLILYKRYLL